MINLWEETIKFLEKYNKTWQDVHSIICKEQETEKSDYVYLDKSEVEKLMKAYIYDEGFGINKVNRYLRLIGDTWFIERDIYDGLENWIFRGMPKEFNKEKSKRVGVICVNLSDEGFDYEFNSEKIKAKVFLDKAKIENEKIV